YAGKLRLSHAKADQSGAGPRDRFYASGIKEIAQWVRGHPNEIVILSFEDRSDGHDAEVIDPLELYLGDLIYRASEGHRPWREQDYDPISQWPSIQQMRDAGKRVLVLGSSSHPTDLIWSNVPGPSFSASRAFEFEPDREAGIARAANEIIGPFDDIQIGTQY